LTRFVLEGGDLGAEEVALGVGNEFGNKARLGFEEELVMGRARASEIGLKSGPDTFLM
jgi:hypothetical protein